MSVCDKLVTRNLKVIHPVKTGVTHKVRAPYHRAQAPTQKFYPNGGGYSSKTLAASSLPNGLRIPRSIHDVDNGSILGFGADLAEGHPGFHDQAYKDSGEHIPPVSYTPEEVNTWGHVLCSLRPLHRKHACREYQDCFDLFAFQEDQVPHLQDISETLYAATGWRIRPVAGLLHPRDFLNGLAFKTFHSTQYMRHHSKPDYTPEPDVIHEVLEAIGAASIGASDSAIWHLTKVYWYTVEFGVIQESGLPLAFGAGLLSSYGELAWLASGKARLQTLDPYCKLPKMSYKDGFQKEYFCLPSFAAGAELLKGFAGHMERSGGQWVPGS